jgi:hypothetical protein
MGAGSEPIEDRVDDVAANADAGAGHGWPQRGEIRSIATSWGATVRRIWPAPVVSLCDHRSRTL